MTPKSPNLGLYLHIPFCHARCGYCDFVTFTGKEDKIDRYVDDLCREIILVSSPAFKLSSSPAASGRGSMSDVSGHDGPPTESLGGDSIEVSTVFFGGGTPSLLEPHHVSQILRTIRDAF